MKRASVPLQKPGEEQVRLADYYGKIRRNMLHKPEIPGLSTCLASRACNADSILTVDPVCKSSLRSGIPTPKAHVKHFMAVESVSLKHIVALVAHSCSEVACKVLDNQLVSGSTTHCHDMLHKAYSLPTYATDWFVACLL